MQELQIILDAAKVHLSSIKDLEKYLMLESAIKSFDNISH